MNSKKAQPTKRTRAVMLLFAVLFSSIWFVAAMSAQQKEETPAVDYAKDIQPIFDANCIACHSNDGRMGGLSLVNYEEMMKGGKNGHSIVAGDSSKSRLVGMIEGTVAPRMPPGGELKPEEVKIIRGWIDAGAHPSKQAATTHAALSNLATTVPATASIALAPIKPLKVVSAPVSSLAFQPNGKSVAAANHKEVRILDAAQTQETSKLSSAQTAIRAISYSPDGKRLAAGGGAPAQWGEVTVWDTATGKLMHALKGHKDYIYSVAFSPDSRLIASSSYDRTIKLWDAVLGQELKTLKDHTDAVYPVAFSPDGKLLASGAADRTVKIWDVATGKRLYTLNDATDVIYTLAFHPSGKQLSAAGADKNIRTWSITSEAGTMTNSVIAHSDEIMQIAYSPDGSRLASTSADRTVKVWDIEQGQVVQTLEKQKDWAQSIAFNPSGTRLAVGSFDGSVKIYEVGTGKTQKELTHQIISLLNQ